MPGQLNKVNPLNHNPLIQSESISYQVYKSLRKRIISGQDEPGTKLVISRLALEYGVSVIPVREALARLHAEKLLSFEQNKGYQISPVPSNEDMLKWHEARLMIEATIGEYVMDNITEQEILELEELNQMMLNEEYGADYQHYDKFIELNSQFHKKIVSITRNPYIVEMYGTLSYGPQVGRVHHGRGVPDIELLCQEHEAIIQAIKRGNVQKFILAVNEHIKGGYSRTIHYPEIPR